MAISDRQATAEKSIEALSAGRLSLTEGWEGVAADAVLDAAEGEKLHVSRLAAGLDDLKDILSRAASALGPAVQAVRDRIADAEAAGLVVGEDSVGPAPGRDEITQDIVDGHVEALGQALDTVASLDQHYGREIDSIAELLHHAIPPGVDREPIPGPDAVVMSTAATVISGGIKEGAPNLADEHDPNTRGRHKLNPMSEDKGRLSAGFLRRLGRFAGPAGGGITVYEGIEGYTNGETTAGEAFLETTGALGGGMGGGAMAGAAAGSFLGPVGTFVGAGIGAGVGAWLGEEAADRAYDAVIRGESDDNAVEGGN
ncbi:hypothetical protein [Dietzia sp. PP-33]|uniref:hypothetical protein n=1 Tax=Dietzia sp. PP-33 TaxID=2957500 RepID=UPI0029A28B75|nr:hypothetical protein [Dietzia sp. PP-33]MDX2358887.1 hypothetical protein [Dietzia sp. PP-33]